MDKGEWSEQRKLGRVGRSTNWGRALAYGGLLGSRAGLVLSSYVIYILFTSELSLDV